MRSPEWSERTSRANETEKCRGHATKGCITARDEKRKDERDDGPREAPRPDGGRKSGENCGKETPRRIGSLNLFGERKLGARFPNIVPSSHHLLGILDQAASTTARVERSRIARAYARRYALVACAYYERRNATKREYPIFFFSDREKTGFLYF